MMNVAYCRTSVRRDYKVSIEMQKEVIQQHVKHDISKWFIDDGLSGSTINRPDFARLTDWITSSTQSRTLYVTRYDRLSRNVSNALDFLELCQTYHVEVVSVLEPIPSSLGDKQAAQLLFVQILFSLAEFTRSVTIENINQGLAQKKLEKKVLSAKVPFGYRYQEGKIVPHPSETTVVRHIFSLYTSTSMGYQKIVQQLQKEGKTFRGKPFKKHHIAAILRHPIYIGQIGHNSKNLTPYLSHDVIPIIHPDIFQQATEKRTRRRPKKRDTREYPLRKKISCPYCDRKLSPKMQSDSIYQHTYHYYACGHEDCTGYRLDASKIELEVLNSIKTYLTETDNLTALDELQKQLSQVANQKEATVSDLRKQKSHVLNQYEQGALSKEEMVQQLDLMTRQLESVISITLTEEQLEERVTQLLHLSDNTIQDVMWSYIDHVQVTPDKQIKEVLLYGIRIQSDVV
ncbi:recombinase family protein [Vagococcus sp. JNUCC 83]